MAERFQKIPGTQKISESYGVIDQNFERLDDELSAIEQQIESLDTLSPADRAKLDGIEDGAQVNQNAYAKVNGMEADNPSDEVTFEGGTGITVTQNPNEKKVTITATGEATPGPHGSAHLEFGSDPIPYATVTTGGLMSAEDKQKLTALEGLPQQLDDVRSDIEQRAINVKFPPPPLVAAVGDGVADDTTAIQEIIDYLHTQFNGGCVYVPAGRYKLTQGLTLYSNIHLELALNAILDFSTDLGGDTYVTTCISASGSVSDDVTLSSDAAPGDTSVSVAPGDESPFAVNDIIRIRSERQRETSVPKDGEFQIVHGTSSGTIEIKDGLWGSYETANNATVEKMNPVENIKISGGTIIGAGDGKSQQGILFTYCSGVEIEGVTFENFDSWGIRLRSCIDINIDKCRFFCIGQTGLGYAISLNDGCQWVTVDGCHFKEVRSAISSGGSGSNYGITRFVRFVNNDVYASWGTAVHNKSCNQFWIIANNNITGKRGQPSVTSDGILVQSQFTEIIGNVIMNMERNGIFVEHRSDNPDSSYNVVGNQIIDSGQYGILVQTVDAEATINAIVIGNNTIRRTGRGTIAQGIEVRARNAEIKNVNVTGNVVGLGSRQGIRLWADGSDVREGIVSGNICQPASGFEGIEIRATVGSKIESILVSSNRSYGGTWGIRGVNQTNCYVTGNMATGSSGGITGFTTDELGDNQVS